MPKERQTCTECSMRRQKCDRNLPCSRCVKRGDGDKCTRDWGPNGYNPARHRVYPRPETKSKDSPTSQRSDVESGASPTAESRRSSRFSPSATDPADSTLHPSLRSAPPVADTAKGDTNSEVTNTKVLNFLAWGRTPLSNFQINSVELTKDPDCANKDASTDWSYSNGFGDTGAAQIAFLQMLLPSRVQVNRLVEYHLSSVAWYHCAIHGPTFTKELKESFRGSSNLQIRDLDLRWAAILFSAMAASMTCASDQQASAWGFQKAERAKLTRQWFKATLSCLNLADYMWRHHIYSVQAIATLGMSAHILGFSNTQSTLMGAALKIAQGLGLQRLGPEEDSSGEPTAQRDKLVRRETGRRLWYQLCVQDWFSIPFSEMYSIQKHHFTTTLPQNVHDETMAPIPENIPTMSSFGNCVQALARLMADSHDAVVMSSTLFTKYEQVMKYEKKIERWLTDLPGYFKIDERFDPAWPQWVLWARRSLILCHAHKIIMIHRNFLGRSFTEPAFFHTRDACMTAAKTILREAKLYIEEQGPILWIDQAFMVAAGISLSLDIFHRKPTDPEYEEHRKLVEKDISMLSNFEDSMIAARGTRLLSSLLTEQARSVATKSLENYRSKRSRDGDNSHTHLVSSLTPDHPQSKRLRQKFDVPRFVESLGTNKSSSFNSRKHSNNDDSVVDVAMPNLFGTSTTNVTSTPLASSMPASTAPPLSYGSLPNLPAASSSTTSKWHPASTFSSSLRPHQFQSPTITAAGAQRPTPAQAQTHTPTQAPGYFDVNMGVGKDVNPSQVQFPGMDFGYETFEQLFPPQTGMSNSFLFEDLLNFDF